LSEQPGAETGRTLAELIDIFDGSGRSRDVEVRPRQAAGERSQE
jgi:hypothetical protein